MFIRYLILYLGGLLWLLGGCGLPMTPAPTPTQAPTPAPPTNTPTVAPEWVTATAMAGFTPTPTTVTVLPATNTAVPTATSVPSPTPQPIWGILFSGVPCPETSSHCDDTLFMDGPAQHYFIYSDGTGLDRLDDLELFPNELFTVRSVRFSPDNRRIAYLAVGGHIFMINADGSEPVDMGHLPDDFRLDGFDFGAENDCIIIYLRPAWPEIGEIETVTLEKRCASNPEPEFVAKVEFPQLRPGFAHYFRLSPDGNRLAIYGHDKDETRRRVLYIYGLHNNTLNKFTFPEGGLGAIRWWSNSEIVEIILRSIPTDFLLVNLATSDTNSRLMVSEFAIQDGDWAPDGHKFVFIYPNIPSTPDKSGIYILDMETGNWQQILSEFYVVDIRVWQTPITD